MLKNNDLTKFGKKISVVIIPDLNELPQLPQFVCFEDQFASTSDESVFHSNTESIADFQFKLISIASGSDEGRAFVTQSVIDQTPPSICNYVFAAVAALETFFFSSLSP